MAIASALPGQQRLDLGGRGRRQAWAAGLGQDRLARRDGVEAATLAAATGQAARLDGAWAISPAPPPWPR